VLCLRVPVEEVGFQCSTCLYEPDGCDALRDDHGSVAIRVDEDLAHALDVLGSGSRKAPEELIRREILDRAREVEIGDHFVWVEDLGDDTSMGDALCEELWRREGGWGSPDRVLAEGEQWHYARIEQSWMEHVAAQLAGRCIKWETGSDRAMLPPGMTNAEASLAWKEAASGFTAWLSAVIEETRRGKPDPATDGTRTNEAPGGRWVVPC
jgi:hypothetical protein